LSFSAATLGPTLPVHSILAVRSCLGPGGVGSIERVRGQFPTITLIMVRLEPAVDLGHHGNVGMPQLLGDELVGRARAYGPDRVEVSGVVHAVVR